MHGNSQVNVFRSHSIESLKLGHTERKTFFSIEMQFQWKEFSFSGRIIQKGDCKSWKVICCVLRALVSTSAFL